MIHSSLLRIIQEELLEILEICLDRAQDSPIWGGTLNTWLDGAISTIIPSNQSLCMIPFSFLHLQESCNTLSCVTNQGAEVQ